MSAAGCTLGAISSDYKNKYDLSAVKWNTIITSFKCHLNTTAAQLTS